MENYHLESQDSGERGLPQNRKPRLLTCKLRLYLKNDVFACNHLPGGTQGRLGLCPKTGWSRHGISGLAPAHRGPRFPREAHSCPTAYGLGPEGQHTCFFMSSLLLIWLRVAPLGAGGAGPVWKAEVCPFPWHSAWFLAATWHVWRLGQSSLAGCDEGAVPPASARRVALRHLCPHLAVS